jgi:D-alanine-D-alanine ligase
MGLRRRNETESIDKNDFSVTVDGTKINLIAFSMRYTELREDGLMRLFELLEIPQTSCDYYQAALTFNKRDTLFEPYGIKSAVLIT